MPQNKKERAIFAFLTVLVTVHAYVFYSLYVVNGTTLMSLTGLFTNMGSCISRIMFCLFL